MSTPLTPPPQLPPPTKRAPRTGALAMPNGLLFSSSTTLADKIHSDAIRVVTTGTGVENFFLSSISGAPTSTDGKADDGCVASPAEGDPLDFDKQLKDDLASITKRTRSLRWYNIKVRGLTFVGWEKAPRGTPADPEVARATLVEAIQSKGLLPGTLCKCIPVHGTCMSQQTEICSTLEGILRERLPGVRTKVEGSEEHVFDYDLRVAIRNNTKLEESKLVDKLQDTVKNVVHDVHPDATPIASRLNKRGKKIGAPSRFMISLDVCQNVSFLGFVIDNRRTDGNMNL